MMSATVSVDHVRNLRREPRLGTGCTLHLQKGRVLDVRLNDSISGQKKTNSHEAAVQSLVALERTFVIAMTPCGKIGNGDLLSVAVVSLLDGNPLFY